MKIVRIVIILGVMVISYFVFELGRSGRETTKERAIKYLDKAGGVDLINREARKVFAEIIYKSECATFISDSEVNMYPVISSLGNAVWLFPAEAGDPANIDIRYGSHRNSKTICIFDPDHPPNNIDLSFYIQVTPNIFFSK